LLPFWNIDELLKSWPSCQYGVTVVCDHDQLSWYSAESSKVSIFILMKDVRLLGNSSK
jgi:hypothetical protein